MMKGGLINLVILLATAIAFAEDALDARVETASISIINSDAKGAGRSREGKVAKIVGFYSQTTLLSLLTRTTSSIYTCVSTAATRVCTGRRRRRAIIKENSMDVTTENDTQIDGSSIINETGAQIILEPIESIDSRTGRRVTVWSTMYSTLDIYTTVPIAGSTVTVSALCNVIGNSYISQSCFIG